MRPDKNRPTADKNRPSNTPVDERPRSVLEEWQELQRQYKSLLPTSAKKPKQSKDPSKVDPDLIAKLLKLLKLLKRYQKRNPSSENTTTPAVRPPPCSNIPNPQVAPQQQQQTPDAPNKNAERLKHFGLTFPTTHPATSTDTPTDNPNAVPPATEAPARFSAEEIAAARDRLDTLMRPDFTRLLNFATNFLDPGLLAGRGRTPNERSYYYANRARMQAPGQPEDGSNNSNTQHHNGGDIPR